MAQETRSTPLVLSEENPVIGRATVKAFILDQTPGDEKFLYAVELESQFWALGKDGKPMLLTKRKGKGHLGGRVEESEEEYLEALRKNPTLKKRGINIDEILSRVEEKERDYVIALIREIEEESGIPPEYFMTKIDLRITWKRSSGADNHEWILYFVDGRGLQEHVNRKAIKDPKLIKLLGTNKVGWARFRDFGLQKTVFAPRDREERNAREEAGDVWFYTGHTVGMCAMLLMIGRRDLFELTITQMSHGQFFTRPMLEMLTDRGEDDLIIRRLRWNRFIPGEKLARRIIRHLLALGREPLLHALTVREASYHKLRQEEIEERGFTSGLYDSSSQVAGQAEALEPVESSLLGEAPDPEDEDPFFADLKERALRGF